MGYNLRYAALIVCCVLAVVVAAAFFPAAGYGDAPDREAVESEYYADTESDIGFGIDLTPEEPDGAADDPDESSDDDPSEEDSEETQSEDEESEDDEPPASSGSSDSSSGSLFGGVAGWLVLLAFSVAGLALCWRLTGPRTGEIPEGELPEGILPSVRFRLRRIPQLTMAVTIGASRTLPTLLDGIGSLARGVGAGLGAVTRDVGRGFAGAAVALPTALSVTSRGFGSLFSLSVSDGLSSLFGAARSRSRRSDSGSTRDSQPVADDADTEEPDFGPRTIEDAWAEMTAAVPVSRRTVRTPGEYARAAVDAGFPSEPVKQLTEAFRDVRYGDFPPSPDRTRRARDAFERIDETRDDDGGERR